MGPLKNSLPTELQRRGLKLLTWFQCPFLIQDQLLGILAAEEKPELEEMKNKLIVESANNKAYLVNDQKGDLMQRMKTDQPGGKAAVSSGSNSQSARRAPSYFVVNNWRLRGMK